MSDAKEVEAVDAHWQWVVATYQGKRSAFKCGMPLGSMKPSEYPSEFYATKLTLITFMPPNKFGVLAYPEENCEVVEPFFWLSRTELSHVRTPSKELVDQLNKAWEPPTEVALDTDVSSAASFAAAKAKRDKSLKT